jgi:hypothetical protein
MNRIIDPEISGVLNALHYRPALSIILPLEANISMKGEAAYSLKIATDKAEKEVLKYYPDEECAVVMHKLRELTAGLDIPTNKKGIAIYVSPVFEKVIYLDTPVQEKVIVDDSFEIRDLIYNSKQALKYILLVLSGVETRVFMGDRAELMPLATNIPPSIYAYVTEAPQRVANFSDMSDHKQIVIEKFLRHIDDELINVIHEYHLPVLVLGSEKILGHFKKLSKNTASIMDYVPGSSENASLAELKGVIVPDLNAWKLRREKELLQMLDDAAGQKRLVSGIRDVWKEAINGKGRLLVVEKNYRFAAQHGPNPEIIEEISEPYNHFSYIRDAVDDTIENVLRTGGDVEFTEDGVLDKFERIALIEYY